MPDRLLAVGLALAALAPAMAGCTGLGGPVKQGSVAKVALQLLADDVNCDGIVDEYALLKGLDAKGDRVPLVAQVDARLVDMTAAGGVAVENWSFAPGDPNVSDGTLVAWVIDGRNLVQGQHYRVDTNSTLRGGGPTFPAAGDFTYGQYYAAASGVPASAPGGSVAAFAAATTPAARFC